MKPWDELDKWHKEHFTDDYAFLYEDDGISGLLKSSQKKGEQYFTMFHSQQLIDQLTGQVFMDPLFFEKPAKVNKMIDNNRRLFSFADRYLDDIPYQLTHNLRNEFELIPGYVSPSALSVRSGLAVTYEGTLSLKILLEAGNYTENYDLDIKPFRRELPARVTEEEAADFIREHFAADLVRERQSTACIPLSLERLVELQGPFVDHFAETEQKIRSVMAGGNRSEKASGEKLIEYLARAAR